MHSINVEQENATRTTVHDAVLVFLFLKLYIPKRLVALIVVYKQISVFNRQVLQWASLLGDHFVTVLFLARNLEDHEKCFSLV